MVAEASLKNLKPRWKKGQSGNPGGRPKNIAAQIRLKTKDGMELVELYLATLRGKLVIEGLAPNHKDRMSAAEWLADRGFGKAPEIVAHLDANDQKSELAKSVAATLLAGGVVVADTK